MLYVSGGGPLTSVVKRRQSPAKLMKTPLLTAASGVMCIAALAQGTFRNMDFEQAQIPQTQPPGVVSTDLAFPFWTVYYGANQQTQVHWAEVSAGSTQASLIGETSNPSAINGGYSLDMFGGNVDVSISQVGQVPVDAVSLLFKARFGGPGHQLIVSMGGVSLPIFDVASAPNYNLYGVDVSQFAGMQEDLRFITPKGSPTGPSYWDIDDIVFSTTPVPEPTTGALFALCGLFFGFRTRLTSARSEPAMNITLHAEGQWSRVAGAQR